MKFKSQGHLDKTLEEDACFFLDEITIDVDLTFILSYPFLQGGFEQWKGNGTVSLGVTILVSFVETKQLGGLLKGV